MILLASCSKDSATLDPVKRALEKRGADVVAYESDMAAQGKASMSFCLSESGEASFRYKNRSFLADEVQAAWYRRPNYFSVAEPDTVKQLYIDGQRKDTQTHMWRMIDEARWLNAPDRIISTNDKCLQMRYAQTAGLRIPKTVISNDWDEIFDTLLTAEVILKLPYGILYEESGSRFLASTIIKRSERAKLKSTNPFPGLWQEYVPKQREWRVTVVGEQVFPVIVSTTHKARDDWRKHQFEEGEVTFSRGDLPTPVAAQCKAVLQKMGLRYGAFDLIETPDGDIVFLEVNANGQYQWLEDSLKLGIPDAIADELLAIAGSSKSGL